MSSQDPRSHDLGIKDLAKSFVIGGRVHPAFNGFDLHIAHGGTTLLRIIAGLETAERGSVAVNGKAVGGVGSERVMVFQEARFLPWLTVGKM
jgi:ABC-type nitrate/sulfonate/bicarbonate transport system ATPase subunit